MVHENDVCFLQQEQNTKHRYCSVKTGTQKGWTEIEELTKGSNYHSYQYSTPNS